MIVAVNPSRLAHLQTSDKDGALKASLIDLVALMQMPIAECFLPNTQRPTW